MKGSDSCVCKYCEMSGTHFNAIYITTFVQYANHFSAIKGPGRLKKKKNEKTKTNKHKKPGIIKN